MHKYLKGAAFFKVLRIIALLVPVGLLSMWLYFMSAPNNQRASDRQQHNIHMNGGPSAVCWSLLAKDPGKTRPTHSIEALEDEEIPEPAPKYVWEPIYGKDLYVFYIEQINEQYYPDVDPIIAQAVMQVESNYKPEVQSSVGAVGLMQVMPCYHSYRMAQYGLNNIWDPYTNIIVGMDFLNDLIHTYGTWDRALLGYNPSQAYVDHVLYVASEIRSERGLSQWVEDEL